MKSFTSKIGVITSDDPPRGGLGRALREMILVLEECFTVTKSRTSRFGSWFLFRLQRWVDRNCIEILMLPTGPGGLLLLQKPKRCRTILICYHTYWQQSRLVPGQWWKKIFVPFERRTLTMADRVLCYSEDTRRVLEEKYGLSNVKLMKQILDMPDAISYPSDSSAEASKPKPKSHICLYIGRKDRRKGYHMMMSAWKNVQKSIPHAELRCITQGNVSDRELRDHMACADLVVVPSYLEGFGLVVAEAMIAGKAVLGCDCDGLRSLMRHKETGWLVPLGDVHALEEAWVWLLKNSTLCKRLGSRGAAFMRENFDRSTAIRELVVECGTR